MSKDTKPHRTTVYRHRKAALAAGPAMPPGDSQPWGVWVRQRYELSKNEAELVSLGEIALAIANDPTVRAAERLQAVSRYQAVLRQLRLEEAEARG
jgi:hypothetical protein